MNSHPLVPQLPGSFSGPLVILCRRSSLGCSLCVDFCCCAISLVQCLTELQVSGLRFSRTAVGSARVVCVLSSWSPVTPFGGVAHPRPWSATWLLRWCCLAIACLQVMSFTGSGAAGVSDSLLLWSDFVLEVFGLSPSLDLLVEAMCTARFYRALFFS